MASPIKISHKEKIGLLVGVVILVLAMGDRLLYAPVKDTLDRLNRETRVIENKLKYSLNNISQKEAITREYQKQGLSLKENGSIDEKTAAMLSTIESLAKKSGIALVDIKPQPPQSIDFYQELIVEVHAEGLMINMIRFLYNVHASTSLLRAQSVHLDVKDKNTSMMEALIRITKVSM